jgi:uncharacterized protein YdhG (YjbR/CyaY superfamily)
MTLAGCRWLRDDLSMTPTTVDDYLADLDEPKRSTLEEVRRRILEVIPQADQCISYSVPGFKVDGKVVAGFAAFKDHLSYLPHSGSVLPELGDDLSGYERTKSALHFPIDTPLPRPLINRLITVRMQQGAR